MYPADCTSGLAGIFGKFHEQYPVGEHYFGISYRDCDDLEFFQRCEKIFERQKAGVR